MSMPTIPDFGGSIETEESISLIIASIGLQELGLAHIINAEGELIQSFLGTLDGQSVANDISIDDLEKLTDEISKVMADVLRTEMLLSLKLETAVDALENIDGSEDTDDDDDDDDDDDKDVANSEVITPEVATTVDTQTVTV